MAGQKARRLAQEAYGHLQRAAGALHGGLEELLRPYGVSPTQYSVLQILRAAGKQGLPVTQVACRMMHRDPDVTRILDRMEQRGLARRERQAGDRRVVFVRMTAKGLRVAAALEEPVLQLHARQFRDFGKSELRALAQRLQDLLAAVLPAARPDSRP